MTFSRHLTFWWIVLCFQLSALYIAYMAGFLQMVYEGDATYLTSVIGAVHLITTLKIGYDTAKERMAGLTHTWFVTEAVLTLGMLGTVLGFLIMMYGAFSDGMPTEPEQIQQVLVYMSLGLGSALWTTAMGLVSSLLLKIQTLNLETLLDKKANERR